MIKIPLFKVGMGDVDAPIIKTLHSGYIGQGPKVEEFEEQLKSHFGTCRVVTTNSCTSAMQLGLQLLDLAPEDEVISTPLTCLATNVVIHHSGARIRWADVSLHDLNIDLEDVERKINENTKAIMVLHWGGNPVHDEHLQGIVDRAEYLYGKRIVVIEDCAHAFGSAYSQYSEQHVGTATGTLGCFSFQAVKNPTCGDGGCLVVNTSSEDYERAKLLRWYGLSRTKSLSDRFCLDAEEAGHKWHMNDIAATIGLCNLEVFPQKLSTQKSNCQFYYDHLWPVAQASDQKLQLLQQTYNNSSCYLFTILVEDRDGFQKKMAEFGIETSPVHPRNDHYSCFVDHQSLLPNMDYLEESIVCIPCGWWVTEANRKYIVDCISGGW